MLSYKNKICSFKNIILPRYNLENLCFAKLSSPHDFHKLPKNRGNYFIVTNKPIIHSFHNKNFPKVIDIISYSSSFNIIYNGISNNICNRIKQHLLRKNITNTSGLSIDLITDFYIDSYSKKLLSNNSLDKTPFVGNEKVCVENVNLLNFSKEESFMINDFISHRLDKVYFKNGIDITCDKHNKYDWFVFYLEVSDKYLNSYIEQKWRDLNGMPKLCSR
jgi:hypothetical protein